VGTSRKTKAARCGNANGYSLHADVEVIEGDRKGLMHLLCYGMRPAFA
jgi:hypothetical protein